MNLDTDEPSLSVADVRLADIVDRPGPFASLYLGPGSKLVSRAQVAIDAVPVAAPHAGLLIAAIDDEQARSQAVITDGDVVWRFLLDDPLSMDLARFGEIPSLGPIIEASQVTTPHVVVTIEDDVFALTSFGTVASAPMPVAGAEQPLAEPPIFESLAHAIEGIRSSGAQLVALMGSEEDIADAMSHLQTELPLLRCNAYPSSDIDRDLLATADEVVKDAASHAAERRTHELAHFRQARNASQTRESHAALESIKDGSAQRLLVHDDLAADVVVSESRMTDRAIAAAIVGAVPITMIPNVPADRGPVDGLGAIVAGHGTAIPSEMAEPEDGGVAHVTV